jgi:hypothetical protein
MQGVQLLTPFSRNTLMFCDSVTAKPVRSKCTLAVLFDAPSSAVPFDTPPNSENVSASKHGNDLCKVPTRPGLQVQASIACRPGLILTGLRCS